MKLSLHIRIGGLTHTITTQHGTISTDCDSRWNGKQKSRNDLCYRTPQKKVNDIFTFLLSFTYTVSSNTEFFFFFKDDDSVVIGIQKWLVLLFFLLSTLKEKCMLQN